jgi:glycosyltransferase involved in cell wall biosynthesis
VKGKVSIIIPCFNGQDFVTTAILSALNQTYENKEVIVINDGSTDRTPYVIDGFRYHVQIITQDNVGLAASRNNGVARSRGDFLLMLDDDDRIDPSYLEKTVPLMDDPKVGVVTTNFREFGAADGLIEPKATLHDEMAGNTIPVCSLIRREAFLQVSGYTTRFQETNGSAVTSYEDWSLWLDLLKRGWKFVVVREPLFYYRMKTPRWTKDVSVESLCGIIRSLHPDLFGGQ